MSCHGNRIFVAAGVFPIELSAKFQWPVLQIGQVSSIYYIKVSGIPSGYKLIKTI